MIAIPLTAARQILLWLSYADLYIIVLSKIHLHFQTFFV